MTALIPVVPATITKRLCSTARSLPNASCWALIDSLNVALLDGTVSNWAPLRTDSRGARSKMTSQHVDTPIGTSAASHDAGAAAGHEIAGPIGVRREVLEEASPRQVLAERLDDLLVVPVTGTGLGIPDDDRVGRHRVVAGVARAREHTADQNRRLDRLAPRPRSGRRRPGWPAGRCPTSSPAR